MVILAHFKKQNFDQLLEELIEIKNQYSNNLYGVESKLIMLLEQSEVFFEQIGKNALESKVSTLRSYISSAKSGIDPQSLEIIKTHKRKIVQSATFYCLSELSLILEKEFNEVNSLLTDSEKTLSQIVLSLVQSGIIGLEDLTKMDSVQGIAKFWDSITIENKQIRLIDMQLRQNILKQDIHLLLNNIFNKLKNQ